MRAGDGEDISTNRKAWIWEMVCLDRVEQFCYLGDMLSRGTKSVSVVRACCARGIFREPSGILTKKIVSLKLMEKVYVTCV